MPKGISTMRKLALLILALAFLFSVGGCEKKEQLKKTTTADFTLLDTVGNQVNIKDYKGKVVLLEFWATWCPPCRMSVPELKALHETLSNEQFALIAIAMNDTKSKVIEFVKEEEIPYLVLLDDNKVSELFKVYSLPTSILLDKEGNAVFRQMGFAPGMFEKLEEDIRELL
jgi:thiol-disulfide isomerase/thioredoxin